MTKGLVLIRNRKQHIGRGDDMEALKTLYAIYGEVRHSDNFGNDALQIHESVQQAGLECRSSTGLGETETPLLEGAHKFSHTLGPSTK